MNSNQAIITYRAIPGLETCNVTSSPIEMADFKHPNFKPKCFNNGFACISMAAATATAKKEDKEFEPSMTQLLEHPLALLALVPRDAALFAAGALAGAAAKTFTAPLDRIKLLMQVISCFSLIFLFEILPHLFEFVQLKKTKSYCI